VPALEATERGRRFIAERVKPYQKEFGWHAVWSHEFIFPNFYEDMNPVIQLVRDQYSSDYDYPTKIAALKADIDAAAKEILEGLEGEALEEMRAANEINLKMAPLTPDHTSNRQVANAHVRQVRRHRRSWSRWACSTPGRRDPVPLQPAPQFPGDPPAWRPAIVAAARPSRPRPRSTAKDGVGTASAPSSPSVPHLWGFPTRFYRSVENEPGQVKGNRRLAGVVEGVDGSSAPGTSSTAFKVGESSSAR